MLTASAPKATLDPQILPDQSPGLAPKSVMPKIVSITSFRHGTGKSHLAANLAVSLAQQGKQVGIVDTDFQAPGIHTLFNLDNDEIEAGLNHYLQNHKHEDLVNSDIMPVVKIGSETIAILRGGIFPTISSANAGKTMPSPRQNHPDALIQGLWELSSRLNLDYLIIDTHPGICEMNLLLMACSDVVFILLGLDQQDFQGSAVFTDIARKLHVPQLLLVVNQVLSCYPPEDVQERVQDLYQEPVAGVLPLCQEMLQLASQGVFSLKYPDHPLTKTFHSIAKALLDRDHAPHGAIASYQRTPTSTIELDEQGSYVDVLDFLALPDDERQVMKRVLLQGVVSEKDLLDHIHNNDNLSVQVLQTLEECGYLKKLQGDNGAIFYKHLIKSTHIKRANSPPDTGLLGL